MVLKFSPFPEWVKWGLDWDQKGDFYVRSVSQGAPACQWDTLDSWKGVRSVTEKAMAPHSSTLALKIPWTEEPGRLQSIGSLRVRYDWATSLSLFTFMHWRRKWQPTPVFLPGESQGQGSLVGCHLWGHRVGHDWSDSVVVVRSRNTLW